MSVQSDPRRPNREVAVQIVRRLNAARVESIRQGLRDTAREYGCEYNETIRIGGILSLNCERDIRESIGKTWGCTTLKIVLNSPGGRAVVGNRIAEDLAELKRLGVRIETHADRQCCSAAMYIFIEGSIRTASQKAQFMLHKQSLYSDRAMQLKPKLLRKLADEMDDSGEKELKMFASRGVALPKEWLAAFRRGEDVNLSANDAHKVGLIHRVTG